MREANGWLTKEEIEKLHWMLKWDHFWHWCQFCLWLIPLIDLVFFFICFIFYLFSPLRYTAFAICVLVGQLIQVIIMAPIAIVRKRVIVFWRFFIVWYVFMLFMMLPATVVTYWFTRNKQIELSKGNSINYLLYFALAIIIIKEL